jgi:hypothetical protein
MTASAAGALAGVTIRRATAADIPEAARICGYAVLLAGVLWLALVHILPHWIPDRAHCETRD